MTTRHLRPACGSWNNHCLLIMGQKFPRLHKKWFLFGWLVWGFYFNYFLNCFSLFNLPNKTVRKVLDQLTLLRKKKTGGSGGPHL